MWSRRRIILYSCVPSVRKTSQNRRKIIKLKSHYHRVCMDYGYLIEKIKNMSSTFSMWSASSGKYRDDGRYYNGFTLRQRCRRRDGQSDDNDGKALRNTRLSDGAAWPTGVRSTHGVAFGTKRFSVGLCRRR